MTDAQLSSPQDRPPEQRPPITFASRVLPPARLNLITDQLVAAGFSVSQAVINAPAVFAQQEIKQGYRAARRDSLALSPTPLLSKPKAFLFVFRG